MLAFPCRFRIVKLIVNAYFSLPTEIIPHATKYLVNLLSTDYEHAKPGKSHFLLLTFKRYSNKNFTAFIVNSVDAQRLNKHSTLSFPVRLRTQSLGILHTFFFFVQQIFTTALFAVTINVVALFSTSTLVFHYETELTLEKKTTTESASLFNLAGVVGKNAWSCLAFFVDRRPECIVPVTQSLNTG